MNILIHALSFPSGEMQLISSKYYNPHLMLQLSQHAYDDVNKKYFAGFYKNMGIRNNE